MSQHLRRSRIAKALTDRALGAKSFAAAEQQLDQVRVAIKLSPSLARTAAGQSAALTAIRASYKTFGNATLVGAAATRLIKRLPIGKTIGTAARALGAHIVDRIPTDTTHLVTIGNDQDPSGSFVRCWWDGWTAGVVPPWDSRACGLSGNPLAGVFAGAIAVREVFASVLGYPRSGARVSIVSLWEPWINPELASAGPGTVFIPPRLWFIGLGHLGQGFLWSLGLLPVAGVQAVLQDDQNVGEENVATGLITGEPDVTRKKARVAADWLDGIGWPTTLIERRHHGDIPRLPGDAGIVVTGLDEPDARIQIANAGFDYMIDAGVGHGSTDFETAQIRVLARGADPGEFWSTHEPPKDLTKLLESCAYQELGATDSCGTRTLAGASVAVPFVGAAIGALTITQAIRIASMQPTVQLMQMELGCPALTCTGRMNTEPLTSLGSITMCLAER